MSQPDDDYRPIPAHGIYLLVMCISVTAAFVLLLADISGRVEFPRGLYSILTGAFVFCGVGYLVRSAENRVSRRVTELGELRKPSSQRRQSHRTHQGHVYIARQTVDPGDTTQSDTISQPAVGIDAESIQAARRISMRLTRPDERG